MSGGLTPTFVEQQEITLEFVRRAAALGVWLPEPTISGCEIEFSFHCWQLPQDIRLTLSEEEQNKAVVERFKAAARAIGGRWEKNDPKASSYNDSYYVFTSVTKIGTARLQLRMERDLICERKPVGTKLVTKPAVEAQPERVIEEIEYERECKPLFAAAEAELEAAMQELEAPEGVLEGELEDA